MMAVLDDNAPFGFHFASERARKFSLFRESCETHFTWIQEIVVEAKKAFSIPDVQLLPKTPSCKRKRKKGRNKPAKRARSFLDSSCSILNETTSSYVESVAECTPKKLVLPTVSSTPCLATPTPNVTSTPKLRILPHRSSRPTSYCLTPTRATACNTPAGPSTCNASPGTPICKTPTGTPQRRTLACNTPNQDIDKHPTFSAQTIASQAKSTPSPSSAQRRHTRSKLRLRKPTKAEIDIETVAVDSPNTPARKSKRKENVPPFSSPELMLTKAENDTETVAVDSPNNTPARQSKRHRKENVPLSSSPDQTFISPAIKRMQTDESFQEKIEAGSNEKKSVFISPKIKSCHSKLFENVIPQTAPVRSTRSKTRNLIEKLEARATPQTQPYRPRPHPMSTERGMPPVRSFLTQLQKQNGGGHSFLHNLHTSINTTPKVVSFKEKMAQKRKEIEEKEKLANERMQQKHDAAIRKADELRKKREERQKLAAKRREEQSKKEVSSKKSKMTNKGSQQGNSHEESSKMARLREKRFAEIEMKKKREEEAKMQKIKELENEQKKYQEMVRKREVEEIERQRKLAEQRKIMEEKKLEAEMERQKQLDKIRKEQIQREREEMERKKQKEEKEKREKAEREKMEIEKQRERERLRREQLEKEREMERQKIREMEAARIRALEAKQARTTIEKHNQSLNKPKLNTSMGSSNSKLNSTFNKSSNSINTYDMTPQRIYAPSNDPNNYDIDNLDSGDSTDDETQPRKPIPSWASGSSFKTSLINQYYNPPDLDQLFPLVPELEMAKIFKKTKPRFYKRTSSAIWDSPILPHKV